MKVLAFVIVVSTVAMLKHEQQRTLAVRSYY